MSVVAIAGLSFTFEVSLRQQANPSLFQVAPTIAAGDFMRSINGGAIANLTNLPTVTPAAGVQVQVVLSAAETSAAGANGRIRVMWQDVAGGQWCSGDATVFVWDAAPLTTVSAEITVTGPVAAGGDVVTYRGDTYLNADGRALEWESDDWFSLAGATVRVIIDRRVAFNGSVVTPAGPGKVRLELTATQSRTIEAGRHLFQVVATQPGGDTATLVEASWVSRRRAAV